MNFQELMKRMVELDQPITEEEKAKKDYDGDGEVESGKDEYMGSRMKAAEKSKEDKVDEDLTDECGMMGDMMPPPPKQMDNVNMNVSMNASGAGGIRDLLNVLKDIQDGPEGGTLSSEPVSAKHIDKMGALIDDDFANEPDETYRDIPSIIDRHTDDLHGNLGDHRVRQHGLPRGNPLDPMEHVTRLESLYQQIKLREGSGSKEKQHSKYVDRNSAESKSKVQAAKDKMVSDKKAEPGKKLLTKIKSK